MRRCHLDFDDVVFCESVAAFNRFVRWYLEEYGVVHDVARSKGVYWALFYKWKEHLVNG